jgi:hypothetical protein
VVGETVAGVPLVTAPTPPLTLPVPFVKTAVSVAELPDVIVGGVEVKLVIAGAAATVIVSVPEMPTPPWESVTLAVKLKGPGVTVDATVPVMLPDAPMLKPVGRLPELRVHVRGPTPPVAARDVEG